MIRLSNAVLQACCLLVFTAVGLAEQSNPIERAVAATFRITNGRTSATAFLVALEPAEEDEGTSTTVLVTAAHCLEQMPEAATTLVLRERNDDATYARKETSIALREGDKPLWVRHPDLDIAALLVELPEETAARPVCFGQVADASWALEGKLHVGSDVFIPGYPATLEGNEAGWPVLRRGTVATHPLAPVQSAQRMFVNAPTFGGDSGAPVVLIDDNRAVVVGIVTGMQRQTSRSRTPFEERVSHMPLALAITLQAPFIRETIELLGKEEPKEEDKEEPKEEDKEEVKEEPKEEGKEEDESPAERNDGDDRMENEG